MPVFSFWENAIDSQVSLFLQDQWGVCVCQPFLGTTVSSEVYRPVPNRRNPISNLLQSTEVLDTFPVSEILVFAIVWLSQAHAPPSDSLFGDSFWLIGIWTVYK